MTDPTDLYPDYAAILAEPVYTVVLPEEYREGLIDVGWIGKSGFGHINFFNENGKIVLLSETMGKEFTRKVLNRLVDVAVLEE